MEDVSSGVLGRGEENLIRGGSTGREGGGRWLHHLMTRDLVRNAEFSLLLHARFVSSPPPPLPSLSLSCSACVEGK